ncbi:MAG: hypothetical protein DME46_06620 [Verrucomicrobia bacterium]|nr:MAG: hypothetical protein DME46_06620 [Verrucomicrobiota bacterium]
MNSLGRRERLPYKNARKRETWPRFAMPRWSDHFGSAAANDRSYNFFKFFARNLKLNRLGFDRTNGARRP